MEGGVEGGRGRGGGRKGGGREGGREGEEGREGREGGSEGEKPQVWEGHLHSFPLGSQARLVRCLVRHQPTLYTTTREGRGEKGRSLSSMKWWFVFGCGWGFLCLGCV